MSDTVAVLTMAREVLVTNGWCQGQYQSAAGEVCALGALSHAAWILDPHHGSGDHEEETIGAIYALDAALPADFPHKGMIARYNDTEGRTLQEILDLFDRAIEGVKQ